ncbi:MAG TPA: Rieske 2Fe-2S domain-containing protein [Solirubrobacteraceae bacterium]|jgi:nitrite reductase/ring-hydroxylating ferredoxin subunit/uncharacterized membrane protein|nr:Rieske 2Fe-2S domain-containing protein [Solirubrobacteraceae bacterium]
MTARRPRAHALSERIGSLSALDGPAAAISKQVRGAIGPGPVKDALSGTWLGHALHPLLTDIPIGTWVSSLLLDAFGGRESRDASRRLIGAGIIASVPTAITGMTEYADSEPGHDAVRRIGALHAVANVAALSLYGASFAARRRGAHATGVMFGAAGASALMAGGWLGSDLAYARGVGVDETTFEEGPSEWTPVLDASMLVDGRATVATVADVDVMLLRRNGTIHALANRCSHRGGPLHEGDIVDGCVQCPWHGSRFRLDDGSVERGPTAYPQPLFEAREQDGRIEVRAAS